MKRTDKKFSEWLEKNYIEDFDHTIDETKYLNADGVDFTYEQLERIYMLEIKIEN